MKIDLATSQIQTGNTARALITLNELKKTEAPSPELYNAFAMAYFSRGRYELAVENYQKALDLNPDYLDAQNNLGLVYIEMGRTDEGIQILKPLAKNLKYPTPEKAYLNLSIGYLRKGETQLAKEAAMEALRFGRPICPAYGVYGQTLFLDGLYQRADELLTEATKACKEFSDEFNYIKGLSQFGMGQKEKAIATLKTILKETPSSPFAVKAKAALQTIR
ncbi:MAG: tetratricopeptide repeat protein [Bdellovibrionales bacterium]|nr:tetratricopeptide repeat protein [Bdellovibrionales bacterium]